MVNWIGSAEKVDDFTVRVLMEEPFPAALEYLAAAVPIYPNEYYEKVGPEGMSLNPVGTGPYRVAESVPGKTITLVRNDDSFEGSPKGAGKIGKIVQRTIPRSAEHTSELRAGALDWTWQIERAAWGERGCK